MQRAAPSSARRPTKSCVSTRRSGAGTRSAGASARSDSAMRRVSSDGPTRSVCSRPGPELGERGQRGARGRPPRRGAASASGGPPPREARAPRRGVRGRRRGAGRPPPREAAASCSSTAAVRARCSSRASNAHSSSRPGRSSPSASASASSSCPAARSRSASPHVDPDAVPQTDAVACGDERAVGLLAELPAQRPERAPQARAGALVEHVRPELRRDRRARVQAGVQRQPGEQSGGAVEGGRCAVLAADLDAKATDRVDAEHSVSVLRSRGFDDPRDGRLTVPGARSEPSTTEGGSSRWRPT